MQQNAPFTATKCPFYCNKMSFYMQQNAPFIPFGYQEPQGFERPLKRFKKGFKNILKRCSIYLSI